MNKFITLLLAWILMYCAASATAWETDCVIHDPSTIVKSGGQYWVFGTGTGVTVYSSLDKKHWTPAPPVFAAAPAWIASAVPANTGHFYWAPEIHRLHGLYFLYYAVSTFGSNTSAIGLATSPSLVNPHWTDRGPVIQSSSRSNYNTIDPSILSGPDGRLWLAFGSYWSGIKMVQLDPATGKPLASNPNVYALAAHPQDPVNSIEAPYLYSHGGYYYLFVNWDRCCQGEKSTYNIRVGRSRSVTGPYLDEAGRAMTAGGGKLFLSAASAGSTGHKQVGSGQSGIFTDGGQDYFSCHYEWAQDHHGAPLLNVRKLSWAGNGWPALSD